MGGTIALDTRRRTENDCVYSYYSFSGTAGFNFREDKSVGKVFIHEIFMFVPIANAIGPLVAPSFSE